MVLSIKTVGGVLCFINTWLLVAIVPIPDPRTYVNSVFAFIAVTSFLVGAGLFISEMIEEK